MAVIGAVDGKLTALQPLKQAAEESAEDMVAAEVELGQARSALAAREAEQKLCEELAESAVKMEQGLQQKCRDSLRPTIRQSEVELEELEEKLEQLRQDYEAFACGLYAQVMGGDDD
jgi:hypothetical protein